jgi:hypothetical protein
MLNVAVFVLDFGLRQGELWEQLTLLLGMGDTV